MGLCGKGRQTAAAAARARLLKARAKPPKRKIDLKKVTYEDMQKIPQTEEDLIEVPVYIDMFSKTVADDMISLEAIKSPALKEIYLGDEPEAIRQINKQQREDRWERGFQFQILMAFWLSVHYGRVEVLNHLIQYDIYLR